MELYRINVEWINRKKWGIELYKSEERGAEQKWGMELNKSEEWNLLKKYWNKLIGSAEELITNIFKFFSLSDVWNSENVLG